jgi:hypothetical protein
MAATVTTSISTVVAGMGNEDSLTLQFLAATSTRATHLVGAITAPGTEQPLVLGSVTSPKGIWIEALDYDLDVDTSWLTPTFEAQITIPAGQAAYFVPKGVVWVKNKTGTEAARFEYIVVG